MTSNDAQLRRRPGLLRRRAAATPTVALLAALLVAGCGLGFDDQPRALKEAANSTTTVVSPSVGRLSTVLYFVREGTLIPVRQELQDRSPATVLTTLTQPPTDASLSGLGTSVPVGTELLDTTRAGDRLIVDLSSDFEDVVGLSRQQAIGQMVMTVTEQGSVDRLEFQVDGDTITVSSPLRGDTTIVDQCDFASLLATPDSIASAGLPPPTIDDLTRRQDDLDQACRT